MEDQIKMTYCGTVNATTGAKTYNGWTNYQTWVVKDWLDNDAATVELQSELLKRAMAYVNHGKWLVVELQSELLTDLLEEWVKDNCPYDDLLLGMPQWMRSAIDEVNFSEIAEHIIEDANRTNF